jgi:hypothetical protein
MPVHRELLLELLQSELELLNVSTDHSLPLQIAFCRRSFCFLGHGVTPFFQQRTSSVIRSLKVRYAQRELTECQHGHLIAIAMLTGQTF